jgi:hypothetical protein
MLPELVGDSNRSPGGSSRSSSAHRGVGSDTWSSLINLHCSTHFLSAGFRRTPGVHVTNEPLVGWASCHHIQPASNGEVVEEVEDGWGLRVLPAKRVILPIQTEETKAILAHPRVE